MSGTESERPGAVDGELLEPGTRVFVTLSAALAAGGLALLLLLSGRSSEVLVLVSLAFLAMVGTFFLFGLAAGHIRFGEQSATGALLKATLGALDAGLQVTDASGRPVYSNAKYAALVGTARNGEPRALEEAFAGDPLVAECIFRLSRAADRGEIHEEEFRVRAPADDRTRAARWLRLGVRPLPVAGPSDASGTLTLWHLTDITSERVQQAEAVRQLAASLDWYENLPFGLVLARSDGTVRSINATLARWLGLEGEAASAALDLADIFSGPVEALLSAIAGQSPGKPVSVELDLLRRDGVGMPVQAFALGKPAEGGAGSIAIVVLDHVAAAPEERESAAAEVSFARFFHSAPFGIATLSRDGEILSANGAFARMFFVDGKAAVRSVTELTAYIGDEMARRAFEATLAQVLSGRPGSEPIEISVGPERQHTRRIYISPIGQARRLGEAAVLYVIDATEQKALELKYAQSQKMEAVGKLAGGIAHDFNNVLTAIIGFSDLLLQTHRPTDPAYRDIMNIKQNANRAAGMVRQLLAFSRRQTLQPEVLELGEVLTDLSILLNRLIGETIDLKIVSGRDLWLVKADRTQFEQVVMNLAVNARDAMPNGGRLTVRTRNIFEREALRLQGQGVVPGEYVMIEVEDTGHGMTPEVMAKIFEPFFSTKEVGKGTGLGLSTVYGIVKQTGGYVLPESTPGKGTTFRVYLPRHLPEAEDSPAAPSPAPKKPRDLTGAGRVLLVEDEDSVRNFAARALKRQGYEVFEASTGIEALELVDREKGGIDIVVSDVVMPEMDGPTLLKALRLRFPDLKVIFVSGYPDDAFKKSLDAHHHFAFLPKPFTLPQLAAKVKEELGD